MKAYEISKAIGELELSLVAEAMEKPRRAAPRRRTLTAAAAVLAVVLCAASLPNLRRPNAPPRESSGDGSAADVVDHIDSAKKYGSYSVSVDEMAFVFTWEEKTPCEKYTSLKLDGVFYTTRARAAASEYIGERLGTAEAVGEAAAEDGMNYKHCAELPVYSVRGVSPSLVVAAYVEGEYCTYIRETVVFPRTLGELLGQSGMRENVLLGHCTLESGSDSSSYMLTDSKAFWQLLSGFGECEKTERSTDSEAERVCFSVSDDALGVYKRVLSVSSDGTLRTNVFNASVSYDIGKQAAAELIAYVKEHSVPAEEETYLEFVVGRVTYVCEEYMTIDDSLLCTDPSLGTEFTVLLDELRAARYVRRLNIKEGDTVLVNFEGRLAEGESTVSDATAVYRVTVTDGSPVFPE